MIPASYLFRAVYDDAWVRPPAEEVPSDLPPAGSGPAAVPPLAVRLRTTLAAFAPQRPAWGR